MSSSGLSKYVSTTLCRFARRTEKAMIPTHQLPKQPPSVGVSTVKRFLPATLTFVILGAGATACAATPIYNPDHLQAAQLDRVSDICETVMGLDPKEPLVEGVWLGEPRIDYDTSHYRVCILSLSDSLQNAVEAQLNQRADADCRDRGLAAAGSDFDLCVLKEIKADVKESSAPRVTPVSYAALPSPTKLPQAPTSYYRASPRDYVPREEMACAALGLEPFLHAFDTCVKGINHALYSIENPIE